MLFNITEVCQLLAPCRLWPPSYGGSEPSKQMDELIDFKTQVASNTTKQRLTAKSLFTQPADRPRYWRYMLKRRESKIPSSKSETALAEIARTCDKDSLVAASQRSTDFRTGVHKTLHMFTPINQDPNNVAVPANSVFAPSSSKPYNALLTTAPLSMSMPEFHDGTVFQSNVWRDALEMSLISSPTHSTPDALRPVPSLKSPFSLKSSISGFSANSPYVNTIQAGIFDQSPAQPTQKRPLRKNTTKIAEETENKKKSTKSNTMHQMPQKVKQELNNKPLPAIPMSVPIKPPVRASKHAANVTSRYVPVTPAPVWANYDESPIDKYFSQQPVVNEKQVTFNMEFDLTKFFAEANNDELVAPLNIVTRKVPCPSGASGNLQGPNPSPNPSTESPSNMSVLLPPSWQPRTPNLKHDCNEEAEPINGCSPISLEDLKSSIHVRPPSDGQTRRLSTIP